MGRRVQVGAGYRRVAMPNGAVLDAGQQTVLTDQQWAGIPVGEIGTMVLDLGAASTTALDAGSVTTPMIADGAVTPAKLDRAYSTPTAHAGTHGTAGSDPVMPAAISAAAQLTPTVAKTSAYTAAAGDLVVVDATTGPVTVTLPAAAAGLLVGVRKGDASGNTVTIAASGSDTIDVVAPVSTKTLPTPGNVVLVGRVGGWVEVSAGPSALSGVRTVFESTSAVPGERLFVNTAGGALNVTLPVPVGGAPDILIKKIGSDASVLTITAPGATLIDGTNPRTLSIAGTSVRLITDGVNYYSES